MASPFDFTTGVTLHIGDHEIPITDLKFEWVSAEPAGPSLTLPGGLTFEHTFTVPRATTHALMVKIARAFRIAPGHLGFTDCACHPSPNPAARDYRRRTKRRRRRTRR